MIIDSPIISGSQLSSGPLNQIGNVQITGSLSVTGAINGSITGSITSASYATTAEFLDGLDSTSFVFTSSFNTFSGSASGRITNLEAFSSSLDTIFATDASVTASILVLSQSVQASEAALSSSYASMSGSASTRLTTNETNIATLTNASASFAVVSSSFATTSGSIAERVTTIEGQDATTGSNTFTGPQYVSEASNAIGFASTASLYTDGGLRVSKDSFVSGTAYFNNVVVYGTSSIQYITSSQVNFGTNIITVNTDTPAVRFGGLAVFDSGSTQLTGSMLWDSQNNHWVYSNPSGSSYSGGMIMSGPRSSALGSEQGTLNNFVMKGQGGDHITSSQIIDDGTTVRIPGNLQVTGSAIVTSNLRTDTGLGIKYGSFASTSGYLNLFSAIGGSTMTLNLKDGTGGFETALNIPVSANRSYTFPNADGTIALTSNLSSYLPLTGGTLTGPLTGSSATFSGNINITSTTGNSAFIKLNRPSTSVSSNILFSTNGTDDWFMGTNALGTNLTDFYLYRYSVGNIFSLSASTGAATFASSVTANGDISVVAGVGILSGGGGYAVGPTSTRGIIAINGSGDQLLTFSSQSYIYNSSSLFRMLSTSDIDFVAGGTQRMLIRSSSGNIAIGGTDSGEKLNIVQGNIKLYSFQNSPGNYRYIGSEYAQSNGNNKAEIRFGIESDTLTFLSFATAASGGTITERMRITSGGNVGIGTTSPNSRLDVRGVTGTNYTSNVTATNNNTNITVLNPSNGGDFYNFIVNTFGVSSFVCLVSLVFDTGNCAASVSFTLTHHAGYNGNGITRTAATTYNGDANTDGSTIYIRNNGDVSFVPTFKVILLATN